MRRVVASLLVVSLTALAFAEEKPKAAAPGPAGLWLGVLKVGPIHLRLAFDIKKGEKGEYTGKLISIDQNRAEVPCKTVTFAEGKLTIDLPASAASYSGKLDDKGKSIKGEFVQLKNPMPLDLERIEKLPSINRPQTPKGPFPYVSEDVSIENEAAKIKLAGTLTMPKGDGPFAAVVLVSGSGPQDRDETLFDHKPFLLIADHLARHGIACLRYDDRGFGKSGGQFPGATSADFATDAYAAVKHLAANKKIDAKRIGICGHSEGGVIAPLVAAEHPDDVGFIILLAGPGISGEQILHEQRNDFSKLLGASKEDMEISRKLFAELTPIMKSAKTSKEAKEKLTEATTKFAGTLKEESRKELEKGTEMIVGRLSDPWLRWFVKHDPVPVLKKVKCPVLAINGELDLQVKPKQNLDAIAAALKAGGNKQVTVEELKGLNHLFQNCKTGELSKYGLIEETMEPKVLERLGRWIGERK